MNGLVPTNTVLSEGSAVTCSPPPVACKKVMFWHLKSCRAKSICHTFKNDYAFSANMALKQVILVRHDLKLPKGKLAVQVAHASVDAVLASDRKNIAKWKLEGMPKIVCKVADLDEMLKYKDQAEELGLVTSLITDAGKTTVAPGTIDRKSVV